MITGLNVRSAGQLNTTDEQGWAGQLNTTDEQDWAGQLNTTDEQGLAGQLNTTDEQDWAGQHWWIYIYRSNNLLRSWNRHVNNSQHGCSINWYKFSLFPTAINNNLLTSSLLNNIVGPRMLLTHDNNPVSKATTTL